MKKIFSRRHFLKTAGVITAAAALDGIPHYLFADEQRIAKFPQKTDLILLTSNPPQLETPLKYFKELLTPNNALFVRWHISEIPFSVDLNEWRLIINGNVDKELKLSMEDLKKFPQISYTAVIQCSGNGRSFFEPRVLGGQWRNGAMGNVQWKGARLKDILNSAGLKPDSVDISFNGLDSAELPETPDFLKSLPVDKALEDDIMVAYEMNGEQLTMLNGFPARLIVPGWYATYWVKSLNNITVLSKEFTGFWMKTAYRIPANPCGCIPGGTDPKKTIPINRMTTRSVIVDPASQTVIKAKNPVTVMGIAFSGGYGIKDVIVSTDNGKTWNEASLGKDMGKYSWVQWFYQWKPQKPGNYTLMARATNSIGESQPFDSLWNPAGYLWNKIEKTTVVVR
ncbi:MAG: molybdopterin-dependent oxidoreductase [Nitrospiraceae bacterium]|nr:molybdopterin-dependent oxidoreductase [Nitrospiraceae bacterium]